MAYLARKRVKGHEYLYIVRTYREGTKVRVKTLEYLGRDPDQARLKRALEYWQVKRRPGKPGGRRG